MKETVVVQIRWGDTQRSGLRTLAVESTSLDHVFRAVANAFYRNGRNDKRHAPRTRGMAAAGVKRSGNGGPNGRRGQTARDKEPGDAAAAGVDAARPTAGRLGAPAAGGESQMVPVGRIRWFGELAAGRLGPAATLVQVELDHRRIMLRLPGIRSFRVGAPVRIEGTPEPGEFFFASLVSGNGACAAVKLAQRVL